MCLLFVLTNAHLLLLPQTVYSNSQKTLTAESLNHRRSLRKSVLLNESQLSQLNAEYYQTEKKKAESKLIEKELELIEQKNKLENEIINLEQKY